MRASCVSQLLRLDCESCEFQKSRLTSTMGNLLSTASSSRESPMDELMRTKSAFSSGGVDSKEGNILVLNVCVQGGHRNSWSPPCFAGLWLWCCSNSRWINKWCSNSRWASTSRDLSILMHHGGQMLRWGTGLQGLQNHQQVQCPKPKLHLLWWATCWP